MKHKIKAQQKVRSSPHMQNIHCANNIVIRGSETRPLLWLQTDYFIRMLSATQGKNLHRNMHRGYL